MAQNEIRIDITGQDRFSSTFSKLQASLITLNQGLELARKAFNAVAGTVSALTIEVAKNADEVGKVSSRLGISTEKLSAYQFAAKQAGLSSNTLNMALQRMTRRVAEASLGSGEAQSAIKELGLSARALATATPDQQLRVFADALNGVESQSDKVRLAFKLFDAEGVALLQMLEGGSAGLNEMEAQAQRLGITISKDTAQAAEDFNDSMGRLNAALDGLANTIGEDLIPAGTKLNDWMTNAITRTQGWYKALSDVAGELAKTVEWGMILRLNPITGPLIGLGDPIKEVGEAVAVTTNELEKYTAAIEDSTRWSAVFDELTRQVAEGDLRSMEQILAENADTADQFNAAIRELSNSMIEQGTTLETVDELIRVATEAMDEGRITTENWKVWVERLRREFEAFIPTLKRTGTLLDDLNKLRDNAEFTFTKKAPNKPAPGFMDNLPGMLQLGNAFGMGGIPGMGGAMSMAQFGPGGMAAGFLGDLLMQDPKMKEAMQKISEALVELVGPLAEVIAPMLEALVPVIRAMKPAMQLVANQLAAVVGAHMALANALGINAETMEDLPERWMNLFNQSMEDLSASLADPFKSLEEALKRLAKALGAGGFQGPDFKAPKLLSPFHDGGQITSASGMRLPGMAPDERMILAQTGETVVPRGGMAPGGASIVISAPNLRAARNELVELMEELMMENRLGFLRGA